MFYQPVFKKLTSAGLNSLRQKEYQIPVKYWIFDDLFHKMGLVLIIWVLGMIKLSGLIKILMKWGCWGHWGHWGCWGHWGHRGCRGFKAWKITTEDFRVIQAFEFSFIFMFWKNLFWVESYWILAPFLSEALEASRCHFFENWLMKHKFPNLLKPLGTINQKKYWSFFLSEPI